MARFIRGPLKSTLQDLSAQNALPVRSVTGYVVSYINALRTRHIRAAAVAALNLQPDDNTLEIGYGRGDGFSLVLPTVSRGSGLAFGIEQSEFLESLTRKRFILEIAEQSKIQLERALDLANMPYPSDFFSGIFHVDSFYFWGRHLYDICHDLLRILKPGGSLVCGMQLSRLRKLEKWNIIHETQYNPARYLTVLEPAGFRKVKMDYLKANDGSEFQLITATKPEVGDSYYDPEFRMNQLEKDIKREMLMRRLLEEGKPVYDSQRDDSAEDNFKSSS